MVYIIIEKMKLLKKSNIELKWTNSNGNNAVENHQKEATYL